MSDDDIEAEYVGAIPPPMDEVEWAMRNPLVGEFLRDLEKALYPWQRRWLALGSRDDAGGEYPQLFAAPTGSIENPEAPTAAELAALQPVKGIRVGGRRGARPLWTWMDEMQEEPVRDERAEEARRIAAEREQADRRVKDEAVMRTMNRAQRRAYAREHRR